MKAAHWSVQVLIPISPLAEILIQIQLNHIVENFSTFIPIGNATVAKQLIWGHVAAADDALEGGEGQPAVCAGIAHEESVVAGGVVVNLERRLGAHFAQEVGNVTNYLMT